MKVPTRKTNSNLFRNRFLIVMLFIVCATIALVFRSFQLQYLERDFLKQQADARHIRSEKMDSNRGSIFDRRGIPLAVSTPVDSVVINPKQFLTSTVNKGKIILIANILEMDAKDLLRRIEDRSSKSFMYLKRHISPNQSIEIKQLGRITGFWLEKEYKRFYPAGEVTGHLVGFTNIDDQGQEGLEYMLEEFLLGEDGLKLVLRDANNNIFSDIKLLKTVIDGEDYYSSIDLRIQYLAHRALKAGLKEFKAKSGSSIVLDISTGEVLAMVNQPSADPNNRSLRKAEFLKNRAVTDVFEPGSAFKPLTVAAALESGDFKPESKMNTSPFYVGSKLIGDDRCEGNLDLEMILVRSCNAGAANLSLAMEPQVFFNTLTNLGISQITASGFPGEQRGSLGDYRNWRPIKQATMSYGYGVSVTLLQLAKAYASIANKGLMNRISIEKIREMPIGERVLSEDTSTNLLVMLESVVEKSVSRAKVKGYRVGGKTGTAQIFSDDYSGNAYNAFFIGVAPISNPRIVTVVVVNEPQGKSYYGGQVAAPIFSLIVSGALRIMGIPPDENTKS
ncbi:MAG: cell division protein [Gammaproteobacteria bacterium]|nr:cell division protein [Gammaproteobacteria bacterium]|tara:strand:+ start:3258 stop:4943 length:1686 start_codon:yes stop_codon:yes gene_type:complete